MRCGGGTPPVRTQVQISNRFQLGSSSQNDFVPTWWHSHAAAHEWWPRKDWKRVHGRPRSELHLCRAIKRLDTTTARFKP